ncbi:beta-N-acetylhexosaminidase [Breznakia pachnodae]|uniref:Hexosaminidase n=1 Tax=Breznakia pachnodae TaxID=265178 RepID=A0ABU0DZ11_9FIRM|nr:glycoside hydrolase family 20 protein [Breznakia pachnodae]MDQ0359875.1 hexosaminidase [Breznakia pachnodae]
MKFLKILTACFVTGLAFHGVSSSINAEENTALIENETYPNVQQYEVTSQNDTWKVDNTSRLFILKNDNNKNDEHFNDVVKLMDSEFAAKEVPSSKVMSIVCGEEDQIKDSDIVITLGEVSGFASDEAYTINVGKTIKLTANSGDGVLYGLRTIMNYMEIKGEMPYGTITDYPDMEERSLHLDIARKYYPKDWIINEIKEMSAMKLNTLQLHFSENEGFRIESKTHPEIVSTDTNNVVGSSDEQNSDNKGYLTQDEVKEIIATANLYGIDVIPSFDAPGHLTHILDVHPEYRLKKTNSLYEEAALDITNPEAVTFIKEIYGEYAELFKDSKYFQIGGDEFIDFGSITKSNYPDIYNASLNADPANEIKKPIDVYIAYLNDIASSLEEKGFVTRVWSDGVYRSDTGQTLDLKSSVQVDYWTRWSDKMASLDTILDKQHDVINFNDNYFYYVLNQHNYKYPNASAIFNEWNLSVFSPKRQLQYFTIEDENYNQYKGVSFSVWSNDPDKETRESVANGIYEPMSVMAEKSWNANLEGSYASAESFEQFENDLNILGHAAGYEAVLPTASDIIYLNNDKPDDHNTTTDNTTDNTTSNKPDDNKNTQSNVKQDSENSNHGKDSANKTINPKNDKTAKSEKKETVKTGDSTNVMTFVFMMGLSIMCISYYVRKKNYSKN